MGVCEHAPCVRTHTQTESLSLPGLRPQPPGGPEKFGSGQPAPLHLSVQDEAKPAAPSPAGTLGHSQVMSPCSESF